MSNLPTEAKIICVSIYQTSHYGVALRLWVHTSDPNRVITKMVSTDNMVYVKLRLDLPRKVKNCIRIGPARLEPSVVDRYRGKYKGGIEA